MAKSVCACRNVEIITYLREVNVTSEEVVKTLEFHGIMSSFYFESASNVPPKHGPQGHPPQDPVNGVGKLFPPIDSQIIN